MIRRPFFFGIILLLFALQQSEAFACTSFIVSGRVTPDGRPILFKNRDTDVLKNSLAFFSDGKYRYIGLVNSDSTWSTMVWGGFNETGFAIMNTAAYNNNVGDTSKLIDLEGVVMKMALQYCSSLSDFETLLDTIKKPMGVDANFGVIDAMGGAAYYETGNYKFVKFDVNDEKVAPTGIAIRTNHSLSGNNSVGYGYIRYETASNALLSTKKDEDYSPQELINKISRNLNHSLTGINLLTNIPDSEVADFHFFTDFIPRTSTASAIMVVGAKSYETASQTMMWTVLGNPLVSVAVPVWLTPEGHLPKVVTMNGGFNAPICTAALQFREQCFPIKQGNGKNYINLSVLINNQGTGFMQLLKPIEDEIFNKTKPLINNNDLSPEQIVEHDNLIDRYLCGEYRRLFGIDLLYQE